MLFTRTNIVLITTAIAGLTAACASKPDPAVDYVAPRVGMEVTFVFKDKETVKADVGKKVKQRKKQRRKTRRKTKAKSEKMAAPETVTHRITAIKGDTVANLVVSRAGGSVRENQTLRSIMTYFIYQQGDGIIREDFSHDKIRSLWPLKIGNETSFISKLYFARGKTQDEAVRKAQHTHDVSRSLNIMRQEIVSVPAGKFRSFVIRRTALQRKLDGTVVSETVKTYWFAPRIGWIVRVDTLTKIPGKKDRNRSLIAVSIKGAKTPAK